MKNDSGGDLETAGASGRDEFDESGYAPPPPEAAPRVVITGPAAGEFDEANKVKEPPIDVPPLRDSLVTRLAKKSVMRLFVGFGVVGVFLAMYPVVVGFAIAGEITIADAKELLQLLTVPATLAGTVVGYLFGREV